MVAIPAVFIPKDDPSTGIIIIVTKKEHNKTTRTVLGITRIHTPKKSGQNANGKNAKTVVSVDANIG